MSQRKVFGAGARKWAGGIAEQRTVEPESINVQFIPLELIKMSDRGEYPANFRRLSLTMDDVKHGPKIPQLLLAGGTDDQAEQLWKEFESLVNEFFANRSEPVGLVEEYLDLARFARTIGSPEKLANPVTVYNSDAMGFFLLAGQRRTFSHWIMGATRIAARIFQTRPAELDALIMQWGENENREDLKLRDKLANITAIVGHYEKDGKELITVRHLADVLGLKKSTAAYYLKVVREPDSRVLALVEAGKIESLITAYKLITMNDGRAKSVLLDKIDKGEIGTVAETLDRVDSGSTVKQKSKAVHSLDKAKKPAKYGLALGRSVDTQLISKVILAALNSPDFKPLRSEFKNTDLSSKKSIMGAWIRLCDFLRAGE
jgi:hypothetical protein